MFRTIVAVTALTFLGACAAEDLSEAPQPLGDFRLGHNVAIADETTRGPFSRSFTEAQIETSLQTAVAERLRRYDGDGLYHLGMNVSGLVLAQPGIPLIYAPKSAMIVDITIFDNRTQQKLNEEPERLVVGEGLRNAVPILGSGLTRDAQAQLDNLSVTMAARIEQWLEENPQWFEGTPGAPKVAFTPPETENGA